MKKLLKSEVLFERAQKVIPGGVNSPVRAYRSVGGTPPFIKCACGALITDADDNDYIDYVGSWGPMILGHAWEPAVEAVRKAAGNSTSFGASSEPEVKMAELIISVVPGLEKIRMVNSGTEACMSAIRLARGYTGRDKIIKFEGCYHGHADSFLIKAGSGALTLGTPDSPGVTKGTAMDTLTATYNDLGSVQQLLEENKNEIAAVIVEPVAGNMGCIPPAKNFLKGLRNLCDDHGSLLIMDEVMTGFRVAPGGAQELYGVQGDIVTFGKIIGAGLPVGALGGKNEIMETLAPNGPVYQAGTLSGNPLAMSAGLALLTELKTNPGHYFELEKKAYHLEDGLKKAFTAYGIDHRINRVGSMLSVFFTDRDVTGYESVQKTDHDRFRIFFHEMLDEGIYLPPSPFESWFVSDAHTYEQLDRTIAATHKIANTKLRPEKKV